MGSGYMTLSASDAVGVLSKMTVPRSRESGVERRDRRWVVIHHAPTAEPTIVARIPSVLLVI